MSSFARAIAICASSAPPVYRGYLNVRANTEFVAAVPPNPVAVNGRLVIAPPGAPGIEMVPLTGAPPQHRELSVKLADPPKVTAFWASASRNCARAIATASAAWRVWKLFCSAVVTASASVSGRGASVGTGGIAGIGPNAGAEGVPGAGGMPGAGVGAGGACCAPAGCAAGAASASAQTTIRTTNRSLISSTPLGTSTLPARSDSGLRGAPATSLRAERERRPLAGRPASGLPQTARDRQPAADPEPPEVVEQRVHHRDRHQRQQQGHHLSADDDR